MTILGQCDSWRIKNKKTRRSKIIIMITIIIIIIRRRRRRNRFVRERRFGGFIVKTMWHNDGCEKGENNRRMTAAYGRGLPRAAASLTQFLGPAGAGSLQAILYTRLPAITRYIIIIIIITIVHTDTKTSRTTLDFRAIVLAAATSTYTYI